LPRRGGRQSHDTAVFVDAPQFTRDLAESLALGVAHAMSVQLEETLYAGAHRITEAHAEALARVLGMAHETLPQRRVATAPAHAEAQAEVHVFVGWQRLIEAAQLLIQRPSDDEVGADEARIAHQKGARAEGRAPRALTAPFVAVVVAVHEVRAHHVNVAGEAAQHLMQIGGQPFVVVVEERKPLTARLLGAAVARAARALGASIGDQPGGAAAKPVYHGAGRLGMCS